MLSKPNLKMSNAIYTSMEKSIDDDLYDRSFQRDVRCVFHTFCHVDDIEEIKTLL